MYQFVLENEACRGPYNAVSTEKVCNRYFMRSLTQVLHRPFIPIPVPSFMLKALYGEMALILLKGTQLSNDKIRNSGFNFNHPKLKDALEDVYQRKI